ncbi:hypothetical protein N7523_010766 [Penicillium sp. IBT 18751x]|nr:hypothetical protein N7523_010766 [Penicillium sp. IBT 18751x]
MSLQIHSQYLQSNESNDSMALTTNTHTASASLPEHPYTATDWIKSWSLGLFDLLPSEILEMILSGLSMGDNSGKLTHQDFCALRQLRHVNDGGSWVVNRHINRPILSSYFENQIAAVTAEEYQIAEYPLPYAEILETYPLVHPLNEYSLIEQVIRDDCIECFELLSNYSENPSLCARACNERGWSFVAIASCSRSFRILETFCAKNPYGPPIKLLKSPANHNCAQMSPLDIMAERHDLYFFQRLMDVVVPYLQPLGLQNLIRDGLNTRSRLELCQFATPDLVVQLAKLGVHLCDTVTRESTAWHAGVSNGPGFLDYLYEKCPQRIDGAPVDRESPLFIAVEADRLDCVEWLLRHGAYVHASSYDGPRRAPIHRAALKSTEESEKIFKLLLSAPGLGHPPNFTTLDTNTTGRLFRSLIEGLIFTCDLEDIQNEIDVDEYIPWARAHEERAVRKCELIWNATDTIRLVEPVDFDLAWHNDAVRLARENGFERLARALERALTHGFNCSSPK